MPTFCQHFYSWLASPIPHWLWKSIPVKATELLYGLVWLGKNAFPKAYMQKSFKYGYLILPFIALLGFSLENFTAIPVQGKVQSCLSPTILQEDLLFTCGVESWLPPPLCTHKMWVESPSMPHSFAWDFTMIFSLEKSFDIFLLLFHFRFLCVQSRKKN